MQFTVVSYAEIDVCYMKESDFDLLSDPNAPGHFAAHDNQHGFFYNTPENNRPGDLEMYAKMARNYGFSQRFVEIMLELSRQNIPYAFFDTTGGAICDYAPQEEASLASV